MKKTLIVVSVVLMTLGVITRAGQLRCFSLNPALFFAPSGWASTIKIRRISSGLLQDAGADAKTAQLSNLVFAYTEVMMGDVSPAQPPAPAIETTTKISVPPSTLIKVPVNTPPAYNAPVRIKLSRNIVKKPSNVVCEDATFDVDATFVNSTGRPELMYKPIGNYGCGWGQNVYRVAFDAAEIPCPVASPSPTPTMQ